MIFFIIFLNHFVNLLFLFRVDVLDQEVTQLRHKKRRKRKTRSGKKKHQINVSSTPKIQIFALTKHVHVKVLTET